MSLITLIDTKDLVKDSVNAISNVSSIFSKDINEEQRETIIRSIKKNFEKNLSKELKNIYQLQYQLMYNFYNKTTVEKTGHSESRTKDLGIRKATEYYYQHQFLHNTTAILDEIFEQSDALELLLAKNIHSPNVYRAYLLFMEESIDIIHFAVEYGCLFIEHSQILSDLERAPTLQGFPGYLYDCEGFKECVIKRIEDYISDYPVNELFFRDNRNSNYLADGRFDRKHAAFSLQEKARKLIRNFAFKDWKVYKEDFYDEEKFRSLFALSLDLIKTVYQIIIEINYDYPQLFSQYIGEAFGVDPILVEDYIFKDNYFFSLLIVNLIYGCYVAKNNENRRRQKEDPRYTGEDFGRIVGVRV